MVRQVSAGFVVFRRTKDGPKFLLLFDRGRDWNFPRGKLIEDEKSLYGAFRETHEETGLKSKDLKVKNGFRAYERFTFLNRERKKVHKTIVFYLAETGEKQVRLSREHDGFGWFLYEDATLLLSSYRERRAVLKKANDFILEPRLLKKKRPHRWHRRQMFPRKPQQI